MPGPPPPPPAAPPPMGPPPPPIFNLGGKSSASDDRGALLSSIRQGAKLKKAVTNDRSAPLVGGTSNNKPTRPTLGSTSNVTGPSTTSSSVSTPQNGLDLGSLFHNGMPKLRPTGKQLEGIKSGKDFSSLTTRSNGSLNNRPIVFRTTSSNNNVTSNVTPQKSFNAIQNDVQSALKKQLASDNNRNRGPPPPAPTRIISNQSSVESLPTYQAKNNGLRMNLSTLHSSNLNLQSSPTTPSSPQLQANSSTLHRKANSSANLTIFDPENINQISSSKPLNRKPHLAPKPPALNGKPAAPPKKLNINGRPSSISRSQSVRTPRSPSPQSPEDTNYPATKFGTVRSNNVLGGHHRTRPLINGRPTAPPPSVPPHQPPPPPNKMPMKPPNHAPPPPPNTTTIPQPPSHAPPPPPSRNTNTLQPQRAPPSVPIPVSSANISAPPPPPRNSSMRNLSNGQQYKRPALSLPPTDLDVRFRSDFRTVSQFPLPGPYRGLPKFYCSKTVINKQQAPPPPPPNHVQIGNSRGWDPSAC